MRPWRERFPDIYEAEREFWLGQGFVGAEAGNDEIRFIGAVDVSVKPPDQKLQNRRFALGVIYPAGYPYEPPAVEFIDPKITRSKHLAAGQPCLFPPEQWNEDVPGSEVHVQIVRWLRGYISGSFARELPIYELPDYYSYTPPTIFIGPETMPLLQGRDLGRFSVREIAGYDLAVLVSVDETPVGANLLEGLAIPKSARREPHNGRWFRLGREPLPIRNEEELTAILADAGHRFDLGRKPRPREFVGLVFDDEHRGEPQWFMADLGASKTAHRPIPGGWRVRAPRVHVVGHEEIYRRLEGIRDPQAFAAKHVAVFGLGAIGSNTALALAREGVGAFGLHDGDRLRPGNIMRHALDLLSVGQPKADAIEVALQRVNPDIETWVDTDHLLNPNVIATRLERADLALGMIGDDVKEGLLSEIAAAQTKTPIIFARTLHAGSVIRVILLRPGQDACFRCLTLHREGGNKDWIEVPADPLEPVFDRGCAAPARPGAGLSSTEAALAAARLACRVLEGKADDSNQWLTVAGPVAAPDSRLAEQGRFEFRFPPHPDCPYCGV